MAGSGPHITYIPKIPHRLTPLMIATLRRDCDPPDDIIHRKTRLDLFEAKKVSLKAQFPWKKFSEANYTHYIEALKQPIPIPTTRPTTVIHRNGFDQAWDEETITPDFVEVIIETYIDSIIDGLVDVEQIPIPGSQTYQRKGEVLKRKKKRDRFLY